MIQLFNLVSGQVRIAPSGDVVGLDYAAVVSVLKLYVKDVKDTLEWVIKCFRVEQEHKKESV